MLIYVTKLPPTSSKRNPKYYRSEGGRYLFEKRLNPDKGWFPLFPKQTILLKPLRVTSEAEATLMAKSLNEEVEILQIVASRQSTGMPSSPRELSTAIKTWLWITKTDKLLNDLKASNPNTLNGARYRNDLDTIIDNICDTYRSDGGCGNYLSQFGAELYTTLKQNGIQVVLFSEALEIYLQESNKSILPSTAKSVKDANKWLTSFIKIVGDKALDKITRSDVQLYLSNRLQSVKSTTVRRELTTIQSIWTKAAVHLNIDSRNPFSQQRIANEGDDSIDRVTASLEETQETLQLLKKHKNLQHSVTLAVMCLTGMRNSEVLNITAENIDKAKKILTIKATKTKNSIRRFPIEPQLEEWLELLVKRNSKKASTASASASGLMNKFLKSNGLSITAYSFRHGFRDRLVEAGGSEISINELMGWSGRGMLYSYGGQENIGIKRELIKNIYSRLEINSNS